MPRKTKDINEEKPVKKESKLNKKIDTLIKAVLDLEEPIVDAKQPAKKSKAKATSTTKAKASTAKATKTKTTKTAAKEKAAKTTTKSKTATPKKTTKSKVEDTEKKTTKKAAKAEKSAKSTKATKATKKETAKSLEKATKTTKKASTKTTKAAAEKTAKKATKAASKSASTKTAKTKTTTKAKSTDKKSAKVVPPTVVEYYDLPYKYNQTVVKVLYQNPTTLFVYWEISDDDIENYKKQYGENFFDTTRPVLVVYNDTMNYSFEIDINDFANSWYFGINDSKCDYRVELIRRPVFYNEKINTDYIHITSSNKIQTPNDRILFSTDEPYTVYFRNTKTNTQRKVNLPRLLEQLNLLNKNFGFPIVRNVHDLYKNIYHIEDVGEFSISLTDPSSGNPSSHSLSSRFI